MVSRHVVRKMPRRHKGRNKGALAGVKTKGSGKLRRERIAKAKEFKKQKMAFLDGELRRVADINERNGDVLLWAKHGLKQPCDPRQLELPG